MPFEVLLRSQILNVATEEEKFINFCRQSKLNIKKVISKEFLVLMGSTIFF